MDEHEANSAGEAGGDVAETPNEVGDPAEFVARFVPADVLARYEVYSYRNAALILAEAHPVEYAELMEALRRFRLTRGIIAKAGGNESKYPRRSPRCCARTAGTRRRSKPTCWSSCCGARRA